jgi:alpha-glucosidase
MRNVLPENYKFRDIAPPVQGTRGHQLAMYVVYQNHLPMMADYPAAYRGQPELKFLVEVPSSWDETRVLHAEMGKCIVVARRKADAWYLGGMTAGEERKLDLPLHFLGDREREAELYVDNAAEGPTSVTLRKKRVSAADTLPIVISRSGGFAARLAPPAN